MRATERGTSGESEEGEVCVSVGVCMLDVIKGMALKKKKRAGQL